MYPHKSLGDGSRDNSQAAGLHGAAAATHRDLANEHTAKAKEAEGRNDMAGAKLHNTAAALHRDAADLNEMAKTALTSGKEFSPIEPGMASYASEQAHAASAEANQKS